MKVDVIARLEFELATTMSQSATPGQSGPGSDGNKGVHYILQSCITRALPSGCLVSYRWESYPSAQMQSVYAPNNWATPNSTIKYTLVYGPLA